MDKLVKAYRLHCKMMLCPGLVPDMRKIFLDALEEQGVTDRAAIEAEARRILSGDGKDPTEEALQDYTAALTDLYFATHFTEDQCDNYINLARKENDFRRLIQELNSEGATSQDIREALKAYCRIPPGTLKLDPSEAEGARVALIDHFISNQLPFIAVAKKYLTIRDIDEMMDQAYWNRRRRGKAGGKAAGMLLAYRILIPREGEVDPEILEYLGKPESYLFNSGILSDFIDYNHLYSFHTQKYKDRETLERDYSALGQLLEGASFPADVVEDFTDFLEKVGEEPLIVRSSSLLEDNFGHAFSGKYDSLFLANQGNLEKRLDRFQAAFKQVLRSTFHPSAILYRRDHDLLDFDERMSVLVQRVVGSRLGSAFFPFASGVAFSRNMQPWSDRIVKEDGMLRLVLGLGTQAVDRAGLDYPRLVALSHPGLRPEISPDDIERYSQKFVDVLDLELGRVVSMPYQDLFEGAEYPDLFYALSINREGHLAPPLFKGQDLPLPQSCITFDNLLSGTPFPRLMKKVMKKLEAAYGRPVDVEFAWNSGKLYILQCRSLALRDDVARVEIPREIPRERIVFTNRRVVSNSITRDIEVLVYVDPKAYAHLSKYEDRMAVVRVVGRLNSLLSGKRYALLGPARWGTTDIKLGVKVSYKDINRTLILGEVAFAQRGQTPEASYGTHFFSDLVEANIIPLAIYPDEPGTFFNEKFFLEAENHLVELVPEYDECGGVVRVIYIPEATGGLKLNVYQDGIGRRGMGCLM